MKKVTVLFLALSALVLAPACKKKGKKADAKKAKKAAAKKHTKKPQKAMKAKKPEKKPVAGKQPKVPGGKINAEQYLSAVKTLSTCKLKGRYIDSKCPAKKAFDLLKKRRSREKGFKTAVQKAARGLLKDSSPTIRWQAADELHSFWFGGAKKENVDALMTAIAVEKDPQVYHKMLRALSSSVKKYPKVFELFIKSADHDDASVRKEAIGSLASRMAGNKKALDKIVEKIEKDKDIKVRAYACSVSYKHWNEKVVLPIYKKYVMDKKSDQKMYEGCFEGMLSLWNAFVFNEKPSKKAYKMTIRALMTKPRTDKRPPWDKIDDFGRIPKGGKDKKVPKWWNKGKVLKVLVDVIADPNVSWLGRKGGCRALGVLNAKKELKMLKKKIKKNAKDKNKKFVLKGIEDAFKEIEKNKNKNKKK